MSRNRTHFTAQSTILDLVDKAMEMVDVDPLIDDVIDAVSDDLYEIVKKQLERRLQRTKQE